MRIKYFCPWELSRYFHSGYWYVKNNNLFQNCTVVPKYYTILILPELLFFKGNYSYLGTSFGSRLGTRIGDERYHDNIFYYASFQNDSFCNIGCIRNIGRIRNIRCITTLASPIT